MNSFDGIKPKFFFGPLINLPGRFVRAVVAFFAVDGLSQARQDLYQSAA